MILPPMAKVLRDPLLAEKPPQGNYGPCEAIFMSPCVFHSRFSIRNIQGALHTRVDFTAVVPARGLRCGIFERHREQRRERDGC
jgi:hypothetical protein